MEIKTKYNIGDKVWTMEKNKAEFVTIKEITIRVCRSNEILEKYTLNCMLLTQIYEITRFDDELFPTKEALLASL